MEKLLEIVLVVSTILLGLALVYLYEVLWLRLEKVRKKLRRQGINGPKPTLLYGNTQEMKRIRQELKCVQRQDKDMNGYISTIFPHFLLWRKTYGMYRIPCFCLSVYIRVTAMRLISMIVIVYFILESQHLSIIGS